MKIDITKLRAGDYLLTIDTGNLVASHRLSRTALKKKLAKAEKDSRAWLAEIARAKKELP